MNSLLVADDKPISAGDPGSVEVEFQVLPAISDRAHRLLSLAGDLDVEFRETMFGLQSEDLAGFANSKKGGAILIGVHAARDGSGAWRAAVDGCTVGDAERRRILKKASQCVPPVPVSIFVENGAETPFYRIEIPSGPRKPYCTMEGIYKTRCGGQNATLYPPQLLALLLETGHGEVHRTVGVEAAGRGLSMEEIDRRVAIERQHWSRSVWDLRSGIRDSLRGIAETAVHVESNLDGLPPGAAESSVRLSSQDLCGFLMRLP